MAVCPMCNERPGKRFCPARHEQICAVCCATHREVDIDCPSACAYLKTGRAYDSDKRPVDAAIGRELSRFDDRFAERFAHHLDSIAMAVIDTRSRHSYMLDQDVVDAFQAVGSTLKTRASGIYFDSRPVGNPAQTDLFEAVTGRLETWMAPQDDLATSALKISDAQLLLDFCRLIALSRMNARPRSREYLDMLAQMFDRPAPASTGRIITL